MESDGIPLYTAARTAIEGLPSRASSTRTRHDTIPVVVAYFHEEVVLIESVLDRIPVG